MKAGVVRDQWDCKPQPGGSCEYRKPEIFGRESPKLLTLGTPDEYKVGVAAAIQSGALKLGEALPACAPLALAELHGHIRFKII